MQVPASGRRPHLVRDDLGQVEAVGQEGLCPLGLRQLGPPGRQQGLELSLRLTDAASRFLASLGIEATEGAVGPVQ